LREIQPTWQIAPSQLIIFDGPSLQVVLGEQRQPVLMLKQYLGSRLPGEPGWTEYEVRDGALNGLSATWWGKPPQLYETATYRHNRRDGPTVYFSNNGLEIARCEYRQDEPWTGRMLQRHGFSPVIWDVSYRNGTLDGAEIMFEANGTTNRLRTFHAGKQHGPERVYYAGVLSSEESYADGRRTGHRSWYANGQLEWEETYDHQIRQHGLRRHWDTNGVLLATEHHEHGQQIRQCEVLHPFYLTREPFTVHWGRT
jgi:antitoxin component YwqK of YwqJK toxin-antitoxin module